MDYYQDTTSVVAPPFIWAMAPYDPKRDVSKSLMARTEFAATKEKTVDFFVDSTGPFARTVAPTVQAEPLAGTASPLGKSSSASVEPSVVPQTNTDVERIAKQRIRLMAAKYASSVESSEIIARLEILNHRLLGLAPRVSKDQVLALENANEQLLRIRAAREDRSKRLGIPA